MPRLAPVTRRELLSKLRKFGFVGPYQEGKHPYMLKKSLSLTIPNEHDGQISVDLLIRLLRQAGISRKDWLNL